MLIQGRADEGRGNEVEVCKECRKTQKLFLLAVSFSGFALRGAEGKPLAPENLDNCTLEKLFEGRAGAKAKGKPEKRK